MGDLKKANRFIRNLFIALLMTTASFRVVAAGWEKVYIPGALCGDGSSYFVFVKKGDNRRLSLDLMGGGACWNFATCWGPTPTTWIHQIPFMIPFDGIFADDPKISAVAGWTRVFFPYCTGDAFMGDHTASYFGGLGIKVYHWGKRDVELSLLYLDQQGIIPLSTYEQVVVEGSSAGAIGALAQLKFIDPLLNPRAKKTLLADAPGLHFGTSFWHKFSPEFIKDFRAAFAALGIDFNENDGEVASQVMSLCHRFSDWRMGFLQGSRDIIMSAIFGNISPWQHEALIYGEKGLYTLTDDPNDNCRAWVPGTAIHTFFLHRLTSEQEIDDVKAMDFARKVIEQDHGRLSEANPDQQGQQVATLKSAFAPSPFPSPSEEEDSKRNYRGPLQWPKSSAAPDSVAASVPSVP